MSEGLSEKKKKRLRGHYRLVERAAKKEEESRLAASKVEQSVFTLGSMLLDRDTDSKRFLIDGDYWELARNRYSGPPYSFRKILSDTDEIEKI